MEVMGRNIGQGDIPEEQARIQRNLWEQITSSVAEGYDPRNTYLDMRASAEADGALSSSDSQYAYLRVYDDITRLEADPTLFHIDHPKAMSDWNAVGEKDRVTPNNEAYFHMQEGTRVSNSGGPGHTSATRLHNSPGGNSGLWRLTTLSRVSGESTKPQPTSTTPRRPGRFPACSTLLTI